MTEAARWHAQAAEGGARAGWLDLPHGRVPTPAFMPVGTRAAVRAVDVADLRAVGTRIVLANTYHLMLRPGAQVVADLGGLHRFMGWEGPILTDSGGYQILSLDPAIDEEGATFRSTYDGSEVHLSPEGAVRIQEQLGPDIAMVLDVCLPLPSPRRALEEAMELTLRWAERSLASHTRADQALFGIVQGGVEPDLRAESARRTAALGFAGYGIGGLSVGEPPEDRNAALAATTAELPADRVRYVMGLGDAEGVLDAIGQGADLFDCVWPTRLARHGRVLTPDGDYNLRRAQFATDAAPLHAGCSCLTCRNHHRAYLRHLLMTGELAVHRLLTIHNLSYTLDLVAGARTAILEGEFSRFREGVTRRRQAGGW
ncbi:MAG: tRNA guanosine(34) transglycosylase Tgt [Actinomycetota bacterium]